MKNNYLLLLAAAVLWAAPKTSVGQVAPALGAASSFAMFTAVGAFDNVGPSVIKGDIGTNAGAFSGFPLGVVMGSIHVADIVSTQAATDVQTAFSYMSTIPCVVPLAVYGGPVSNPQVLIPGSYCVGAATTLAGNLILDAQNNPNALFFLRVSGALTTAASSTVTLINGASAANVYWQVTGRVDLGQNSVFRGTLLVDGAINLIQGASLIGRGLSRGGAITIDTGTATLPSLVPTATSTFWLGSGTTDWFTAANWSDGVPTSLLDAVVPTGTSPYPLIASGSAAAKTLTIGSSASLTQSGGTLDVKGALDNSGTISATAGTVTLSGTTAQAIGGGGSTQFWGLAITNTAGATQTGAVSIHGVLALTNGGLSTGGRPLMLLSDPAGTALVDNAGGTVSGAVTVQRYIAPTANPGLGYRHYSAPVSNTTVADLATAGFSPEVSQASTYNASATPSTTTPFPTVFAYDQTRVTLTNNMGAFDKGFVVPASLTTPLGVGQGYAVNIGASQVVDFVGTLTTGDQVLNLSRNSSASTNGTDAGWQLLGNPYPAPLDYSLVALADRSNLDAAIYVYASASQYGGTYRSYANGVGNPVLPVAQGFFARVSTGQTSGTLTFRNSQRLTALNNTTFQRTTTDTRPLVQLELRGTTGAADALYAYAETGATPGFDAQYDALKLPNTTGLNLASVASTSEALAIDGRPAFTTATVLPLTVGVPAAGTYTLTGVALNNLPATLDAFLTDAATGQLVNLRTQPDYTFSVTATQAAALLTGRFTLSFGARSVLATATALTAAEITLYPNPAHNAFTVLVPAVAGATQLHAELLNSLGQVVRRQDAALLAAGARLAVDAAGLAAGVYALRLQVGATTLAKRVVIQ
ncbi:ice-binding family protein [Hymenobacter terricola]|uniref:ice-binding family protein n=1 Tax=Hymenobacter terricola TaxID=2819236 RepID=UPI001B30A4D5|nr:ice-binding family protein [Hymenobacter terricola]